MRDNTKAVSRMAGAAKLGAEPVIDARLVRFDAQHVAMAGDGIHLSSQPGYPEGMDHVERSQFDVDRTSSGNVEDILCAYRARIARLGKCPMPPLCLSGDANGARIAAWQQPFANN